MGIFLNNNYNNHVSHKKMITEVTTANTILKAEEEIRRLITEGYSKESLYVIAHSEDRAEHVANHTNTNTISIDEEGMITAIANLFRSQGDELRAKLVSMGISKQYAKLLEAEMEQGKIVIIAWNKENYKGDDHDPLVNYSPFGDY